MPIQTGGAGGEGRGGASGGAGAASTLTNAVSGQTSGGALQLYQTATGGAGGYGTGNANATGGAGTSSLTFSDLVSTTKSATLTGKSTAVGGLGGYESTQGATGGKATADLTLTGAGAVTAASLATGGAGGGASVAGTGGNGGNAKATTTAVGGAVNASSSAVGGLAGGVTAVSGIATAKTKAAGTSGAFSAQGRATTPTGQLIISASAEASGTVDGTSTAKAKAEIGGPAVITAMQGSAVSLLQAAPIAASVSAVFAANPTIATAFGAAPTIFAIGELGGAYSTGGTGVETVTDTMDLTVQFVLSKLTTTGDLKIGLFDPIVLGSGFSSLTIKLQAGGTTLLDQTFTSAATLEAAFHDMAFDLGPLGTGGLNIQATVTVVTDAAGQGAFGEFIIGDPPATSGPASQRIGFTQGDGQCRHGQRIDAPAAARVLPRARLSLCPRAGGIGQAPKHLAHREREGPTPEAWEGEGLRFLRTLACGKAGCRPSVPSAQGKRRPPTPYHRPGRARPTGPTHSPPGEVF